jgi:hypothetical protein
MRTYRTSRPLIVEAIQSAETKTIATDLGFINVRQGEWVVCGEGGECYIVDDAFFRRTFVAINGARTCELGDRECAFPSSGVVCAPSASPMSTTACRDSSSGRSRLFSRGAVSHARHR